MASDDVLVQNLFKIFLLALCGLFILTVFIRYCFKRILLDYRRHVQHFYDKASAVHREQLFKDLQAQAESINRPLRILELGVHAGVNFSFYPNGCDLVCLSLTSSCEGHIQEMIAQDYPNIRLVDSTQGGGDLLAGLEAFYFDVVVFTHTLKEEQSPTKTVWDIYRVLKQNGRCYFMEYTVAKPLSKDRCLELIFRPLYSLLAIRRDGVRLDTLKLIKSAPFRDINSEIIHVDTRGDWWESILIPRWTRWLVIGTATK